MIRHMKRFKPFAVFVIVSIYDTYTILITSWKAVSNRKCITVQVLIPNNIIVDLVVL